MRVCCAKVCIFLRYRTFYHFMGLSQYLRWNLDHFQVEFLWFLWGKWTNLRLFYWWVCCAKMCIYLDFALINDSVGHSYFLVILWLFSCVIISISKYLPICTKFSTHIPQCHTLGWLFVFISSNFKFYGFYWLFQFFGTWQNFEVKSKPLSNRFSMVSMG